LVRAQEGELLKPYSNVRLFLFIVFIMHYVYILHSEKSDRFYIGYTSDISTRLEFHKNAAHRKFTYNADDWKLRFSFECGTKSQALAIDKHIKADLTTGFYIYLPEVGTTCLSSYHIVIRQYLNSHRKTLNSFL